MKNKEYTEDQKMFSFYLKKAFKKWEAGTVKTTEQDIKMFSEILKPLYK